MGDILSKTLEELDGQDWGEPTFSSYVVMNCHRLRRVPLREFTIEDLRLMVGQSINLEYLLPLALERLQQDPLAEGDFYPGDLLAVVLMQEASFWQENSIWCTQLQSIINTLPEVPEEIEAHLKRFSRGIARL